MTTLWDSVEANAWSRDFDYQNYILLYKKVFPSGTPFKEVFYKSFCQLLESNMEKDLDDYSKDGFTIVGVS